MKYCFLGTVRSNRIGNPKEVTSAKLKKEDILGQQNEDGIAVCKWKDHRDVLLLTTKHDLALSIAPSRTLNQTKTKPDVVIEYNQSKQGIDLSDQMASYFSPLRKTVKYKFYYYILLLLNYTNIKFYRWFHKLAFEVMLNTVVVNALIIYKELHKMDHSIINFCQSLIEAWSEEPKPKLVQSVHAYHLGTKHKLLHYEGIDQTN